MTIIQIIKMNLTNIETIKCIYKHLNCIIIVMNVLFVSFDECSFVHLKTPTKQISFSKKFHHISDRSSLPNSAMINNNNDQSFHKFQNRNLSTKAATITKLSVILLRLIREMPNSNVDESKVLCQTDQDCHRQSIAHVLSIGNSHNDTFKSAPWFICINNVCHQQDDNINNNSSYTVTTNTPFAKDASSERLRMLPIMIVLGVMFVGICVAMNLFSRARFKNQRSGIFANPRILKVANAQNSQNTIAKRRRSKVSTHRSRTELLARAQQMSQQLQKQQQQQPPQQYEIDKQESEQRVNRLQRNKDKLSINTPTVSNQIMTYVQVECLNNMPVICKDMKTITENSSKDIDSNEKENI